MRYYNEDNLTSPDGNLTPTRIHYLNPESRFIVVLREPVERTISSFKYFWTKDNYRSLSNNIAAGKIEVHTFIYSLYKTQTRDHQVYFNFIDL